MTAIFTLPHNIMSKPDTNNKLLAKADFPIAVYTNCILVLLLLCYFASVKFLLIQYRLYTR